LAPNRNLAEVDLVAEALAQHAAQIADTVNEAKL
jgi:hypothetical protein